jgi:hypothetical protein
MIKTLELSACSEAQKTALERVNYFPRQLLTVDDMVTEFEYFRQKLRRHNLFLHGWGIVCGLEVTPDPTSDAPSRVKIGSGYAIGPYGDEIYVADAVFLDLARCDTGVGTDPCEPSLPLNGKGVGATVYVAIMYAECLAKPVRAMPVGCACDEDDCQYSRIRDSFQISCLDDQPLTADPAWLCDTIGKGSVFPCPPCPTNPWLVLAKVTLSTGGAQPVPDNSVRRMILSTAVLQRQLIKCCCGPQTPSQPPLATVTAVDPADKSSFDVRSDSTEPSKITITFNKDLLNTTVNQSTIIVRQGTQLVEGQVDYQSNTAHFVPKLHLFGAAGPNILYTLTVVGSGDNPIRDIENLALDGDKDGVAGGDFTSTFTINFGTG